MAGRRFEMHHYRQALLRMRQGQSDREIAAAQLMGRRSAAQLRGLAQNQGWLQSDVPLPLDEVIAAVLNTPKKASSTISSLESQRECIAAWLAQGIKGVAIHAALQREKGWGGSYSSVARLVRSIKAKQAVDATQASCRLHFEPAQAAQVDFGAGPMLLHPDGKLRRTWAFVMTLCFSRHQYVEFVWDQSSATWLGCHRRAFEWFCGVPRRLIIDNAKCAITKACAHDPQVQRAYAECAEGYGFIIEACAPRDPQKKGIVEAGVKYLKGNFLPLRQFRDLSDLNAQVRSWIMQHASRRIHGTTRRTPLELFELERALLLALPTAAPDLGTWHRVSVHRDCHVQFERVLYSVPFALIGQVLWLRATDSAVTLYAQFEHVVTHPKGQRPGQRLTIADHLPPQAQSYFAHDQSWCVQQASQIGPACKELIEQLLSDHIVYRLRAAQGVISLQKPYGAQRLEAACQRALAHNSPHYRTVKTILSSGADKSPLNLTPQTPPSYSSARFVRDAATLFDFAHPQHDALH